MTLTDDTKNLNAEPDIPFAEALSVPGEHVSSVQATPTAPTEIPSGAAAAPAAGAKGSSGGNYHLANLGRQPKSITCPNCQQSMKTEVDHQVDAWTIVFCIVLFLLFWPIFWLPFVLPPCKSAVHVCPKCRKQLGKTPTCCG